MSLPIIVLSTDLRDEAQPEHFQQDIQDIEVMGTLQVGEYIRVDRTTNRCSKVTQKNEKSTLRAVLQCSTGIMNSVTAAPVQAKSLRTFMKVYTIADKALNTPLAWLGRIVEFVIRTYLFKKIFKQPSILQTDTAFKAYRTDLQNYLRAHIQEMMTTYQQKFPPSDETIRGFPIEGGRSYRMSTLINTLSGNLNHIDNNTLMKLGEVFSELLSVCDDSQLPLNKLAYYQIFENEFNLFYPHIVRATLPGSIDLSQTVSSPRELIYELCKLIENKKEEAIKNITSFLRDPEKSPHYSHFPAMIAGLKQAICQGDTTFQTHFDAAFAPLIGIYNSVGAFRDSLRDSLKVKSQALKSKYSLVELKNMKHKLNLPSFFTEDDLKDTSSNVHEPHASPLGAMVHTWCWKIETLHNPAYTTALPSIRNITQHIFTTCGHDNIYLNEFVCRLITIDGQYEYSAYDVNVINSSATAICAMNKNALEAFATKYKNYITGQGPGSRPAIIAFLRRYQKNPSDSDFQDSATKPLRSFADYLTTPPPKRE